MTNSRVCTIWGLTASAILLAPIIVIFFIPLTIGIGLDIFDLVGETPFALALCAPAAFLLVRQVASRASCTNSRRCCGRACRSIGPPS